MDESPKKTNYFVRILISFFCLMLAAMVFYKYIYIPPKGEINAGIITLLAMILVLVLAESFDNFSIGKLISISRDKKKKEKEIEKLEKHNNQLLSQLITVSSSQTQMQSHINVSGDYHAAPSVQKATDEEVQENKESIESSGTQLTNESTRASINWKKLEEIGFNKYLQKRSIHPSNLIIDAKFVNQFQGIDPISNMQPIFDGYIKESDHETFIEIRTNKIGPMTRDRIYVMLSKINYYRNTKRVDAHLDLVLVKVSNEESRSLNRLLESFEPAIASGILKIHEIELSDEEAAACREN